MACVCCSLVSSDADDWMHWRGPLGTGASPTAKPPIRWNNTENVRWENARSWPGFWFTDRVGKRVYVVSAVPVDDKLSPRSQTMMDFCLFCFDRDTGELMFKQVADDSVAAPSHSFNQWLCIRFTLHRWALCLCSFRLHAVCIATHLAVNWSGNAMTLVKWKHATISAKAVRQRLWRHDHCAVGP